MPERQPSHRRRRTASLFVLLLAATLVFIDLARSGSWTGSAGGGPTAGHPVAPATAPAVAPAVDPASGRRAAGPGGGQTGTGSRQRSVAPAPGAREAATAPADSGARNFPVTGSGTFRYAGGTGVVLGASGPLRRFRVAVENGTGQDVAAFAAEVDAVLGDRRSWVGSGRLRLRRVPAGSPAQFTIYLASSGTSERMCAAGGLDTRGYTSCRLPGRVIVNLARWWRAVPRYGAPLREYRAYVVNHEVGHELGRGHEACPRRGRLAPVMQQQTLGLRGCRANGWPYVDGRRYTGPRIP